MALLSKFSRLLREASHKPSPTVVHHLRTTARRLEAVLNGAVEARPKLAKCLRRVRRHAGRVRDLDVQMGLLRQLRGAGEGRQRLLQLMQKEREGEARRLSGALGARRRRKLMKELRLAEFVADPAHGGVKNLELAWAGFAALDGNTPSLTAANLHEFRKRCKLLRYRAETALPSSSAEFLIGRLKAVQDAVGQWHDWAELARRAREVLDDDAATLRASLARKRDAMLVQALRESARVRARLRAQPAPPPRRPPQSVAAEAARASQAAD